MEFTNLEDTEKYTNNVKEGREVDRKQFEPFIDKKVTIQTKAGNTLQGKIVNSDTHGIMFMARGQRSRGKQVTAGLFSGFYATITVSKIKEGW